MERYHDEAESKSVWIATGSWESEASGVNGDGERESDGAVDDEDIGEERGRDGRRRSQRNSSREDDLIPRSHSLDQDPDSLFWHLPWHSSRSMSPPELRFSSAVI